jgi:hypothetical protein
MSESTDAAVAFLDQSGLILSEEERARLIRIYPTVKGWVEPLRMVEARYSEPALVYSADDGR